MSGPITVLVVERSQTFAMYLGLLLRRMGLQSLTVTTVKAAQAVLADGGINFLLVGEPGEGWQVSTAVKTLVEDPAGCRLPLVAIALREDETERQECLQAGCRAYLLRPVPPRELHQALYANLAFGDGKRRHLRSSVELNAEVTLEGSAPLVLRVVNLSRGGALIACRRLVPIGTRIGLALPLPDGTIPLAGSVIYTRRDLDEQTACAFAVLFDQEDADSGDRIDQYLETLLQKDCSSTAHR